MTGVCAKLVDVISRRVALGLFLLVLLASLPLAYASPPDQTWIGGWYDDADYDDVVSSITATVAVVHATPDADGRPVALVVEVAVLVDDAAAPTVRLAPRQPRAPPIV